MLGVGLLCTSSTRVLALPAPRVDNVLAETAFTPPHHDAEPGVVRAGARVSATPARLPAPGVFRISVWTESACGARRLNARARSRRVDRRPLARLVTRRLRLPRASTSDDPDD
jgi:hypothetical protein